MSRPVGTNKDYQQAVKIVENMLKVKVWVNKNINSALKIMKELMEDDSIKPATRIGVAKDIIKLHALFYQEQEGVADPSKYKKKKKSKDKEEPKSNGFLSLKFEDRTGTED